MSQLSLFSAEARPSSFADVGGLLCGPATISLFGTGDTARLGVAAADEGRAAVLRAALSPFGLTLEPGASTCAGREHRTSFRRDLVGLARAWTDGQRRKTVPADFHLDGSALRLWVLAAGRPDGRGGYLLALDPAAPGTHTPLIGAATRLGLPPARVDLPPCPACAASAVAAATTAPTIPPAAPTAPPVAGRDAPGTTPHPRRPQRARRAPRATATAEHVDGAGALDLLDPEDLPVVDLASDLTDPTDPSDPGHPGDLPDLGDLADLARVTDLGDLPVPLLGPAPAVVCRTHHEALRRECRAAGPALRITGARRMQRLVELVGTCPAEVDPAEWPRYWGRSPR